jgi:tRNA-Thr(GGU) m(6)t(6)A37 methyltransferase TsaA
MEFVIHPIGVICSPYTNTSQTPIQSCASDVTGKIEFFPDFIVSLQELDGFSHLHLQYLLHRSSGYALSMKPFLDDQMGGLFALRLPCWSNAIGLSIVRLIERHGCVLEVEGVDMFDCTPLLDSKPYVSDFDRKADVCTGWYATRSVQLL